MPKDVSADPSGEDAIAATDEAKNPRLAAPATPVTAAKPPPQLLHAGRFHARIEQRVLAVCINTSHDVCCCVDFKPWRKRSKRRLARISQAT